MMKRKLFIGSSREGLFYANQIKNIIIKECGNWLECEVWNEGGIFSLNKSTLDNLVNASRRFDYGVLVATNDDLALIRLKAKQIPRDNVIFEMGLFLGSLGLTRAFLVAQDCKLPSDYNGITTVRLPKGKKSEIDIRSLIQQLKSTKKSFTLKTVPSTALAVGYFDNFIKPCCKMNNNAGQLHVIIPNEIHDIKSLSDYYEQMKPSVNISVYGDNQRPTVKRLKSDDSFFWDIPSTLSTLNKMINMVMPDEEVGMSKEKRDWIEYEIRNFVGTLAVLLKDDSVCRDKVSVDWYE